MAILVDFDKIRIERGLTMMQLANEVGITQANLFVLKNNRGKGVRFSTLNALCKALSCQPGEILRYVPDDLD